MVTTNLPFDEWTEVIGSERLTGALLDRLTHHVHILEMNGESYRLKRSRENAAAQAPDESDNPEAVPEAVLTHPDCCQPASASVTLLTNNWRGHLRWPMTSLVVHFCSAPLVCFVDALDTRARERSPVVDSRPHRARSITSSSAKRERGTRDLRHH